MDGVILFADDKVFQQSYENEFFHSLLSEKKYPVIAVDNIDLLEKTVRSISTYKAVILDWNFIRSEVDHLEDGIEVPNENPSLFLLENDIYSLIYIYSDKLIENTEDGKKLKRKYGNKISFKKKNAAAGDLKEAASNEQKLILQEILKFEQENPNLEVPFIWSRSINKATQEIFRALENADRNWIAESYNTASKDPVEPAIEVINLFQNLLAENIIQDENLIAKIKDVSAGNVALINAENYAKVVRILYYGSVKLSAPIMTGDIIKIDNDRYGIIITPECDIRHVLKKPDATHFELLCFSKDDFKKSDFKIQASFKAAPLIEKFEHKLTGEEKLEVSQSLNKQKATADSEHQLMGFTQTHPRVHLLPCFEFEKDKFDGIAKIDFRTGLNLVLGKHIKVEDRVGKLNTPYIQELRQRYFAYKGRVGVPGHSESLRKWLLEKNS